MPASNNATQRKLYIINNGLKDLRGHYFETSIAVAEAAQRLGLRPILAGHVDCPKDLVPAWIEFHPTFSTDHWMGGGLAASPPTNGALGELAAPTEGLDGPTTGAASFQALLSGGFAEDSVADSVAARLVQTARIIALTSMPPVVFRIGWKAWTFGRRLFRNAMGQPVAALGPELRRNGFGPERLYVSRFRTDLLQLLALTNCRAGDHVFLPTAHGRELAAIHELLRLLSPEQAPTFHLEFRHNLEYYQHLHGVFFRYVRASGRSERIRLYTDTEELSQEYSEFSGAPFGLLPIPFRSHLLGAPVKPGSPLCIAFVGVANDQKGFGWLPDLVDFLMPSHLSAGRVRFLIQAFLVDPASQPETRGALERLRCFPDSQVRLVGLDGPLSPESYYELVSDADILVCPYDPVIYRRRSSGTLTEAIALGIPSVVPKGTWLERQQPRGTGETFSNKESFLDAVRQICDDYSAYHTRAVACRDEWLAVHSPDNLVRVLMGA